MNLPKSKIYLSILSLLIESAVVLCYEDDCGIYPSCEQFGDGSWQILEDCHKYIICETVEGQMKQTNKVCDDENQVFTNEYDACVDWDRATECKTFQEEAICLAICPRVMLLSTGPGLTYQERRTGCFRIDGSLFGNTLSYYKNLHGQFLTPDATSTPLSINWIVSEKPGSFNGGIKNDKYDYIRCPFDNWKGWQVDKGLGHWVSDESMTTLCYRGDEVATTPVTPVSTSTIKHTTPPVNPTTQTPAASTTTTQGNQPCKEIGPNPIPDVVCTHDFYCCLVENGQLTHKTCTCDNGLFYDQDFGCTWGDMMDPECSKKGFHQTLTEFTRFDHTCNDGTHCQF